MRRITRSLSMEVQDRAQILSLVNSFMVPGETFKKGIVSFGFDDGTPDAYTNGLPLLTAKGIKATFYVNGSTIDAGGHMTAAQLLALKAAGHDIECHGYDTTPIIYLTDEQLHAAYANQNEAFIAKGLPAPKHTAFGGGYYDDRSIDVVSQYRLTGRSTDRGFVNRDGSRMQLMSYSIGDGVLLSTITAAMDLAKANKTAMTLYGHKIGVDGDPLSISLSLLASMIDYAKGIDLDILTISELYDQMYYIDLRLSRSTGDTTIIVNVNHKLDNTYSVSIERSTDGINFAEIAVLESGINTYSDINLTAETNYYYRARTVKGSTYQNYSRTAQTSTVVSFTLTATGTGVGVTTLTLLPTQRLHLTLDGTAKFYTDAAGTLGESSDIILPAAAAIIYLRCPSGTANLKVQKNAISQWQGWLSGTNAASISGDIGLKFAALNKCTYLKFTGNNTLSGDVTLLTQVTNWYIRGGAVLTGVISNPDTTIIIIGSGVTFDITNFTKLGYLEYDGTGNPGGDITLLTLLTYLKVSVANTIFGSITNCTLLGYIYAKATNRIAGDLSKISSIIRYVYLPECAMVTYTAGGNWGALSAGTTVQIDAVTGFGYNSAMVDLIIQEIASTKVAGRAIIVRVKGSSQARTSASDAARDLIVSDGGSVTTW